MTKTYSLWTTNGYTSELTLGIHGIKITHPNADFAFWQDTILFIKIYKITPIMTYQDYKSFKIVCSTLEKPKEIITIDIKMNMYSNEIDEAYKFITEACVEKRDEILGIIKKIYR